MSQSPAGRLSVVLVILIASSLISNAADYPSEWSQMDTAGLASLAQNLNSQGDSAAAQRKLLASYTAERYSTNPPVGRQVWRQWLPLIQIVGTDLPAQLKLAITESLKQALMPDEGEARQLEGLLLTDIGKALISLGRGDLAALCAKEWVDARTSLDDISPTCLAGMAKCLKGAGGYAKAARLRIANLVATKYLTGAAAAWSVSCSEWEDLVTSLKDDISPSDREAWRTKLRRAFGSRQVSCGDLGIIHWVLQMLGDKQVNLFAAEWVKAQDTWQSWRVADLVTLGRMLGWGYEYEMEKEVIDARRTVAEEIVPVHLKDSASVGSVPCEDWQMLAKCYGGTLADEARAAWAGKLRAAFVDKGITGNDLALLVDALRSLGDEDAIGFVTSWLNKAEQRMAWSASDYLAVAGRIMGESAAESSVRERLAERLALEHLAEAEKIRSVGLSEWADIARAYAEDLPSCVRVEWAAKVYASYESDRHALSDEEFDNLDMCLVQLGSPEMASLLSADRDCHRKVSVSWDTVVTASPAWRDAAWQRLCWSVAATTPVQRSAAWREGIRQLSSDSVLPPGQILATVDELSACLAEDAADGLSPDQVLADLVRLSRDYEVREGLCRRIEQWELRTCVEALPTDSRDVVMAAVKLADAGKATEAIAAYSELLDREDLAASGSVISLLRAELLALLLEQEPIDLGAADKQLGALVGINRRVPERVWNLACRALLKRVAQTQQADRRMVWSDGIKRLPGSQGHIFAATFADLDQLLAFLSAEDDPVMHRILADIMLLTPELASMVRLQQRRVAVFASDSNWQEAKTAAVLCVMMSNALRDGPLGCVSRCADIMRFAGAPLEEVESFRAIWAGKPAKAGGTPTAMVDSLLADAAKAALETAPAELPPRRLAYLHLFAGQVKESLRHIHAALTQAKDENEIFDRLDDIQAVLAASGCDLWDSDCFSRWLASASVEGAGPTTRPGTRPDPLLDHLVGLELASGGTEASTQTRPAAGVDKTYSQMLRGRRADIPDKHLARRGQRLVRWGAGALRDKEETWSRNCLTAAINMQQEPEDATLAIDSVVAAAVCAERVKDVELFLETVVPLVRSTAGRRHLLYRLAVAHYNQGAYEGCLKCLKSADALAKGPAEKQDMAAGILHARLLIELARYEDAAGVLEGMRAWPGTPEQHARALFLTGWTHLQSNDTPSALSSLKQVVDRFPETAVAAEAARVLSALKGT